MNNIINSVFRSTISLRPFIVPVGRSLPGKREFTRTLWHMSRTSDGQSRLSSVINIQKPSLGCTCGCGSKFVHTKDKRGSTFQGERELAEFLTEEIAAERKSLNTKAIPSELDGFKVKLEGADVELTKTTDKEKIVLSFNVNHTVDSEDEPEIEETTAEKPNFGEMKSKPTFEVDIVKGKQTLSFTCSFLQGPPAEGEYNDVFGIDELTIYEGEHNDKVYAVAGDVLDGYLYDLLMNLLEEKGVSNEFVEKLGNLSTAYEHCAYVGLLEKLSKFTVN